LEEIESVIVNFENALIVRDYEGAKQYLSDKMMETLKARIEAFSFIEKDTNPLELLRLRYATNEEELKQILDSLTQEELKEMAEIGMYTGKAQLAGRITEVSNLEFTSSFKEVYALVNTEMYAIRGAEYQKRFKLIKEKEGWKIDLIPIV
jgi:hypothetical protein